MFVAWGTYREDLPLLMNRKGYDEQTWFTFSYSPVRDESGKVAGMFCAGTISITAASVEGEDEKGAIAEYMRICIPDTGGGMPPDVLTRVFEPFFTTKDVSTGSGLGLPDA